MRVTLPIFLLVFLLCGFNLSAQNYFITTAQNPGHSGYHPFGARWRNVYQNAYEIGQARRILPLWQARSEW